ncbi:MAG: uracil-DNA glycosylase [Thiomicrospira sp.]|uniref:uracil-DNA glycosylase n=1 Tax=Thiomicrospira sp. TaxID=935 RepID=UPI001A0C32F8|nr:uracil-DNA glycosylase [Thiomicrospira sp.]MBE0493685.1 uracil-DNA glycosylase [Thiomicrospira sp.]
MPDIQLEPSWLTPLQAEFDKAYMHKLRAFLSAEKQAGKPILPKSSEWFNALNSTPFELVKVVILGQDPYPTPGHAHGLSFSVLPDVKPLPKSLLNINKELLADLKVDNSRCGYLLPWAKQGVLLLNAVLTVEANQSNSHQKHGWEQFTDAIIHQLNQHRSNLVFILWGAYAQKKGAFIDRDRHLVIQSPHPSPLSAHRGFFGSRPFSQTNAYLTQHKITPINWSLDKP